MTTRTWIGRLFARQPRTSREEPVRFRPRLERFEDRLAPTVNILNNYTGLSSDAPPDTCGAAGPYSYVETVNSSVAIYDKGTGTSIASYDLPTFFRACPHCGASDYDVEWSHQVAGGGRGWQELDGYVGVDAGRRV